MDQYPSSNMYPEHNNEPSNADSREVEDIYVPYEGYEYGDGPSTVQEVDVIKEYDLYMESVVKPSKDGDNQQAARVLGFSSNNEWQAIVKFNHSPILNTKVYDVMFPDGAVQQYSANTIVENIYSQVD